jgi:hypothetical protein
VSARISAVEMLIPMQARDGHQVERRHKRLLSVNGNSNARRTADCGSPAKWETARAKVNVRTSRFSRVVLQSLNPVRTLNRPMTPSG